MTRSLTRGSTTLAMFAAALVAVGAATAGSRGAGGETGVAGSVQSALQSTKTTHGTLPFTGISLTIFVAVALALCLVGFLMRRAGREHA